MQFDAQKSVFSFVEISFPPTIEDQTLQNYQQYFYRLLNKKTKYVPIDSQAIEREIDSLHDKTQAKRLVNCISKIQKSKCSAEIVHFLFRTAQYNELDTSAAISTIFSDCSQIKQIAPNTIITEIQTGVNHSDLMRDLCFCLGGIEGQYIYFNSSIDSFCLRNDVAVPYSIRQLINILCECGWLYKKISIFCQQQQSSLIVQALQNAIKKELISYYKLIADFEGKLQSNQMITFKWVFFWLREYQDTLLQIYQVLSIISTNSSISTTSALIINTLNHFCKHGCPIVSSLFSRLQYASCYPFIKYINSWMFEGTQNDISKEFFIERDEQIVKDQGELWVKQYKLNYEKIPTILSYEDAYKIFDTGRAINWLRNQCELRNWHLELQPLTLDMLYNHELTSFVNLANMKTNNQLVSLLFNKFKLKNHLYSIKQYLLLGNGVFGQDLIEILSQELSKHAHLVYKHTLMGLVETALRQSNAPTLIQQKLSIKLLEPSKTDLGWDIFCLDYEFNEPLNTVFNNKARLNYQKIFNNIWRIKRVEYTLIQSWSIQINFKAPSKNSMAAKLLNSSLQLMNEMIHFIKNFFSYILLEAIETPFKKMMDEVEKITDLDSLISVHEKFQQEVIEKTFLNDKLIYENLQQIFEVCLRFCSYVQDVLDYATDCISSERNDQYQQSLNAILKKPSKINAVNVQGLERIKTLQQLREYFRKQMIELISLIQKEDRLKFLQFKLDFNEYYLGLQQQKMFSQGFDTFVKQCLPQQLTPAKVNEKPLPIVPRPIVASPQDFVQIKEGIRMLEESKKKQESQQKDFCRLPPKPPTPVQSPGFQIQPPGQQSLSQMMQQFQQQQQQLQVQLSRSKTSLQSQSPVNQSYQNQSPQLYSQQFLQTQPSYLSNLGPSAPFSHQSQSQISIQQDNLLMSQDENILQMMGKYDDDSSDEDLI